MSAPEIVAEWAERAELVRAMPAAEAGRIRIGKAQRKDGGPVPARSALVVLVARLVDKGFEFRTRGVVLAADAETVEIELLPEEGYVREMLGAYLRDESVPYAHRYGRRVRMALRITWTTSATSSGPSDAGPGQPTPPASRTQGAAQTSTSRDVGEGGLWVLTAEPPPVGSVLRLRIEPAAPLEAFDVDGRVVASRHKEPEAGMGIELTFADRGVARDYARWFGALAGHK